MKYCLGLLILLAYCSSCQLGGPLDQVYSADHYEQDYLQLMKSGDLSEDDLFLLDYVIVRQRDYYNYEVKDKSYGEILALAKSFAENGLPAKEVIEQNGKQDYLSLSIVNEGPTFIRKQKNSSRLLKKMKFQCVYKNRHNRDIVLQNSSFLIRGPFKEHLSTLGYELNCLIKANGSLSVNYIADVKSIKDNLLYNGDTKRTYFRIDSLINRLQIVNGGVSVITNTALYKECNHADTRVQAFISFDYAMDFETLNDGSPKAGDAIQLGKSHYIIEEGEEPVNLFQATE